ncbi:TPA: hypothetical protein DIC38_02805 [Candidatus Nomurabacteria bacterium]|nr:MAG: hypothetical protein O210_OD1C00001G0224 [Parcubacteria bacterium RAAC4_OD1_1]HCY26583.1 hypothetical protein [Candidatus Nomurabacteria bacterium]
MMIKHIKGLNILLTIFLLTFASNVFANVYNAVDVIGQNTIDGTPVWTTSSANNAENIIGVNAINDPEGDMAVDTVHHRLFVNDSSNNRVLVFNLNTDGTLVDHNADYVLGQPDFDTIDFGTTQSKMSYPWGLAYDSVNNRLFVAEYNRILVFDTLTITNGMNASYVLGQPDFTSNTSATSQNGLNGPANLAYDSINNRLYAGDYNNNRIMIFNVSNITNGMNASYVLGQPDFTTNTYNTNQNGLNNPYGGLSYDSDRNYLYVGDSDNSRIMVFDMATIENGENAINVLGQLNFTTTDSGTTQYNLSTESPYGLTFDQENKRLFVTDGLGRVLVFDTTTIENGEYAINILGQINFTTAIYGTTQNNFNFPSGTAYDYVNNRLYIADDNNNRIMIFDLIKIDTDSLDDGEIGTAYSKTFESSGYQGVVTYEVGSGSLPDGLTLTSDTLSGTPTTAGTYTFTIKASDTWTDESTIEPFTDSKSYTIEITNGSTTRPRRSSGSTVSSRYINLISIGKTETANDLLKQYPNQINQVITSFNTPNQKDSPINTIKYKTRTLKYKMIGNDVKELQSYLNTHNYPVSLTGPGSLNNETTYFGLKTKQAVIKFQLANNLVGDGIVGKMTRGVMK